MKTSLPIHNIPLYDVDNINRWYYTVVFTGDYSFGNYKEGVGSHTGVDIDATKYPNGHTDVFAVMNGVVDKVSFSSVGFGYHLVIKHQNAIDPDDKTKLTTLYSCYCHLSAIDVKTGDLVIVGQKIAVTGSTGNSSGPHLHFQIDKVSAPFHPYWPFSDQEALEAGYNNSWQAISDGFRKQDTLKYCVNPMKYVQENLESEQIFPDVSVYHDQFKYINLLAKKGIVHGYLDGFFLPDQNVTRAEFLKIFYISKGIEIEGDFFIDQFSDVKKGDWFAKYVSKAFEDGLVRGFDDGTFGPQRYITRAEAFKIVALNSQKFSDDYSDQFGDVLEYMWFARYAVFARENNLLDFGQYFYPNKSLNRAETCEIFSKIFFDEY